MLCACSGEQFKIEEPPQSPESLATRDFSASGLSSRTTGDWESKFEDIQVDEAESTLKEALSLNYEEARALLGRLEFQRGNFDAALQVFQGIEVKALTQRMTKAIVERNRPRKPRSKPDASSQGLMSMHSVSLLLEAILLKARSLERLGRYIDAAKECKTIIDTVESALPNGILPGKIGEDCKLQDMFHRALELLPSLWVKAGFLDNAIAAYRRALVKPWNLEAERLAVAQKRLAAMLLYGGVETNLPLQYQVWGQPVPRSSLEEAILLLLILMRKVADREIRFDPEIVDHLTYALSVSRQFELLAEHIEQILPGIYGRAERWYFLALCYSAAGEDETALNLLKKVAGRSESSGHFRSFLLGAKLCSENPVWARNGIEFSRRAVELESERCQLLKGRAHRFLGVCYGSAARVSVSDHERSVLQIECLESLSRAALGGKDDGDDDPEVLFCLGLENAVQRNVESAFESAVAYTNSVAGGTGRGWKLLALVASAKQQFKDAETIVDFALDEAGKIDQLELLRLKAVLQVSQEQPKQAIETYRVLLAILQTKKENQNKGFPIPNGFYSKKGLEGKKLESEAWQDLAFIYTKLDLWSDAKICADKAKLIEFYSPRSWHTTGELFGAQCMYKEALISFSLSLSIQPDYVPSIVSTAGVLMKFGNRSLPIARSFLMNALRLEPTNHEAWLSLGLVSKSQGLFQQAAEFFQAAHELKMSAPVQALA